jgi:dTDP-4-amino-4,6-dideoxygalactose transaminase
LTRPVPFVDLRAARRHLSGEIETAVSRVLESGWYVLGPELEAFERQFAEYLGCRNCVGVGSGLSAIELALRAAGVGPGDEVIVPAYTWFATWLAVTNTGARPVGVDVEGTTYNIDPRLVEEAITPRTAAIVPVHLRGQPAEMNGIAALAEAHGLRLIEDAAQAAGASFEGRRVGALGDAGAFSFYPTKNLGGIGDGGAVATDDDELADRVRQLRNYGLRDRENFAMAGANSRLGEVQAAALRVQVPGLDERNLERAQAAQAYEAALGGHDAIGLPVVADRTDPVWHLFVIDVDERDECRRALAAREIETLIHYPVLPHQSEVYRGSAPSRGFPVAERLAARTLSLPIYPGMDPEAGALVADSVLAAVTRAAAAPAAHV